METARPGSRSTAVMGRGNSPPVCSTCGAGSRPRNQLVEMVGGVVDCAEDGLGLWDAGFLAVGVEPRVEADR